jgi:hypothetical protein
VFGFVSAVLEFMFAVLEFVPAVLGFAARLRFLLGGAVGFASDDAGTLVLCSVVAPMTGSVGPSLEDSAAVGMDESVMRVSMEEEARISLMRFGAGIVGYRTVKGVDLR